MKENRGWIQKWEVIRNKGKSRSIWIQGVLLWGLSTGVLWAIIMELFSPSENPLIRFIVAIIAFPLGGIFFGSWMWSSSERGYKQLTAGKPN